ncbi:MAG: TonB-dependent receptor, partial [Muribaculaceae bacterium]|nr:TonB-dependent receptor [Muribaculaceae bacterium]
VDTPVQRALTWSARWFRPIGVAGLNLSLDTYFSLTFNQPEFNGNLLDAIDIEYSPFMFLTRMRGYNWGASIQVGRNFGPFTGNLAYSYGLGRTRTYEQGAIYHPAANEPGNTLNITLGWSRRHWQLNAAFRYADGRRYTPIEALYIIGGNLAMKYGTRNSGRLPSYQRLDLSATYTFQSGGRIPLTHLVNISLINAYGHRNTEMQYFVIDDKTGNYKLKRLNSMYRFLPSVSYTIQF